MHYGYKVALVYGVEMEEKGEQYMATHKQMTPDNNTDSLLVRPAHKSNFHVFEVKFRHKCQFRRLIC